jgi:hypothetical protein
MWSYQHPVKRFFQSKPMKQLVLSLLLSKQGETFNKIMCTESF